MQKYTKKIVNWFKIDKVMEFTHQLSNMFPKLAILYLYMKIFTTRTYRFAGYVIGAIIILTDVSANIAALAMCRPFAYFWDKSIPGGKCGDVLSLYRYICIPNLFTDCALLILPLPAISKLHIKTSVKVGILVTFLTGSMCVYPARAHCAHYSY
jgi:hypothetical protein